MAVLVTRCGGRQSELFYSMNEAYHTPGSGKIEENSAGLGVASVEEVEQRAKELAVIAGRSEHEVNKTDRAQACLELSGEWADDAEEEGAMVAAATSWGDTPGSTGHRVPTTDEEDDSTIGERLVTEGAEEALHDEMLEAHKKNIDAAS